MANWKIELYNEIKQRCIDAGCDHFNFWNSQNIGKNYDQNLGNNCGYFDLSIVNNTLNFGSTPTQKIIELQINFGVYLMAKSGDIDEEKQLNCYDLGDKVTVKLIEYNGELFTQFVPTEERPDVNFNGEPVFYLGFSTSAILKYSGNTYEIITASVNTDEI